MLVSQNWGRTVTGINGNTKYDVKVYNREVNFIFTLMIQTGSSFWDDNTFKIARLKYMNFNVSNFDWIL